MRLYKRLWQKITQTKALSETSGYYESAFFEPVYRVFYLAGLSNSDDGFFYKVYSNFVKWMMVAFVGAELWYLFSQSSNLDKIIDNINVTLIHLIAFYRYHDMMRNKLVYKRLAAAMEVEMFDVSTSARLKILSFWIKRSIFYLKLLLGLGSCTLAVWYIYPLVDDVAYNLTVAVRLPYDHQTPTLYPVTYLLVLIAFNYTSYFVMVNDLIMQTHLMHLLCQYSVLADCLQNILKDCGLETLSPRLKYDGALTNEFKLTYLKRLRKLAMHHQFIVSNTLELKGIWRFPMLCQFMASSLLICFAGYQVTTTIKDSITKFLMSVLYLSYNMFELYIFCRWCDEIKIQSVNIGSAVYNSGWETLAHWPGVSSGIVIIMTRASKPLVMSAGGLYDLSLASYSTLVKTSYSALTVLLRSRKD